MSKWMKALSLAALLSAAACSEQGGPDRLLGPGATPDASLVKVEAKVKLAPGDSTGVTIEASSGYGPAWPE